MKVGDTQTLTATVIPSNATDKSITWYSYSPSVATVSSSGVVTAMSVGTARIVVWANDGGEFATCFVTVSGISVTGVSLNKTSMSMTVGDTQTLTATITPTNATDKSVSWSSSNTSVATVSSSGVVTAKSQGTATIIVSTADGGRTATCSVSVSAKTVSVTGISLNKTSLSMEIGESQTLIATVSPSNATDKSVSWSSSNTSVATVSSSGVVTAKSQGTATIIVSTVDGGKTATCSVSVSAKTVSVTGVSLNKTSLSMTVGDTQTLTATITPTNATNKSVSWSSSNTSVATVSSSGVVTAKATGTATIIVSTVDGGKTATCTVAVSAKTVSVTGVSLNKTSLSMEAGDTQTLIATVSPSNATDKSVSWSTNNASVATVSSSGVVTAKSSGSAVITATSNNSGKTASCSILVDPFYNGYEFVDLGLPSGVKWATCNVGATTLEEHGSLFAWGEVSPKASYSWENYKWGGVESLTKYVKEKEYGRDGYIDNKVTLDPEDDAAHAIYGGSWRIPTEEEWDELFENCTKAKFTILTYRNSIRGIKLVSNINGAEIEFLDSEDVFYWTSSLGWPSCFADFWLVHWTLDTNEYYSCGDSMRYVGKCIRPVFKIE